MNVRDELREKRPEMAARAKKGRRDAIRLHCLECQGGSSSGVSACEVEDCFLHPFRLGTSPTARTMTDEQRAAAAERLAKARAAHRNGEPPAPEELVGPSSGGEADD